MTRALAIPVAAVAAAGAWSALLGRPALWIMIVVAVATAIVAAGRFPSTLAATLLAGWPVAAVLAAGAPPGKLLPGEWDSLVTSLADGLTRLTTLGPARVQDDPWAAAVWLLATGALWVFMAGLAVARTSRPFPQLRSLAAFGLLITPWAAAMALRQTDEASWQGAAVLLAAVLWFAPPRAGAVRPMIAFGAVAALASVSVAHAAGPRAQWFTFDELVNREPQFKTLDTTQTYGPLRGRRTGATMLEVTSPRPALWRMQVLERFGWRGWEVRGGIDQEVLPEPAAENIDIEVRVRGLRNDMAISPGRIQAVAAPGKVLNAPGEGRRIVPIPKSNASYRVTSSMVNVNRDALRYAMPPSDPRLERYISLGPRWGGQWISGQLGKFGAPPEASPGARYYIEHGPLAEVADLAQGLAAGSRNQLEVVERVERFLTGQGLFRYSTDVRRTDGIPLADFLLTDRIGYCQHFAGGAALLLRLAGVPTRVVGGFATGKEEKGRYKVRDADAHAWIEVYFQGLGWVPFNPTPSDADAEIAREIDPLTPPKADAGTGGAASTPAVALVLALPLAVVAVRRIRGRRGAAAHAQVDALLDRVAARAGGEVIPATTLTELRARLSSIGPGIAEVAAQVERARYAPAGTPQIHRPTLHVVRALAADLGILRALLLVLAPATVPARLIGGRGALRRRWRAARRQAGRAVIRPAGRAVGRAVGRAEVRPATRAVGGAVSGAAARLRRRAGPVPASPPVQPLDDVR